MNFDLRKFMPLIILGLVAVLLLSMCGSYNTAVGLDEGVKKAWSQVENQYQRRADLIPNLVNTVQGYANFEKETITAVIEARAKATSVTIDPSNMTEESLKNFDQAQQGLGGALSKLMVVSERYPELKANANFMDLQKQLEGTENRVALERKNFNESVNDYNASIRRFPMALFAGMFGFSPKPYFQSQAGSEKAPTVNFK
jgi:LemA protein